ncbi:MAG: hypothetical protein NTX82_06840 [Candidatus Parcubacteria bacterium]|nr:hypothetical protein [Candidatus Parcubacteria bacterium]
MTLRSYIILMLIATIACYLALGAMILFFDPLAGGILALIFFYLSLFLALVGTFAIFGLIFRILFTSDKLIFKKVTASFRQGIWFSLLIIICLYLNSMNLLVGKYIALLILALALLEIFFISYKSKPSIKI